MQRPKQAHPFDLEAEHASGSNDSTSQLILRGRRSVARSSFKDLEAEHASGSNDSTSHKTLLLHHVSRNGAAKSQRPLTAVRSKKASKRQYSTIRWPVRHGRGCLGIRRERPLKRDLCAVAKDTGPEHSKLAESRKQREPLTHDWDQGDARPMTTHCNNYAAPTQGRGNAREMRESLLNALPSL